MAVILMNGKEIRCEAALELQTVEQRSDVLVLCSK